MTSSISALVVASALLAPATPQDVLKGVIDHYKGLKTFSMIIEHYDGSGVFVGDYEQRLRWKKGDIFDLVVSKKIARVPGQDPPGPLEPDYYCADGRTVTIRWLGVRLGPRPLAHGSDTPVQWESSGGLILSVLLGSPEAEIIFNPPPRVSIEWSFGTTKQWQGEKVQDVQVEVSLTALRNPYETHIFVSQDGNRLVGALTVNGERPGWAHYKNQVANRPLPKGVGVAPAK